MARVPLPERGQPLDVSYIYSLAAAINDLATQVSQDSFNYSAIQTDVMGVQNSKTSDLRFTAGKKQVYNGENVIAEKTQDGEWEFPVKFKYPPIVTITPENVGGNQYGNNVIVSLKNVTTDKAFFTVRPNKTGEMSLSVNIIAIGIPL